MSPKMCQKFYVTIALVLSLLAYIQVCESQSLPGEYYNSQQKSISSHHYPGTERSNCPPWFIFNNTTSQCECGSSLGGRVNCNDDYKTVYIINCNCMTKDDHLGVSVGSCFINCYLGRSNSTFEMYYQLPPNPNELNILLCERRWNRGGRFCGKCKYDYYPLVYSYDMKCEKCTDGKYNWLKFVVEAFVPLTVFFIFIVTTGISASSPQLDAFVVVAQTIATPANVRMILEAIRDRPTTAFLCRLVAAMYGVWNLDFFRTLLPPVCLRISTLQALALDYLVAVYPLVLIIATYVVIDLYDRRLFLLVWLWKPFKMCTKSVCSNVNVKSSIIHAFITFLLLSYVKFLSVSFDLLAFVNAYVPSGKVAGTYLFYDATIEYFGKEHLPYGILAITVLVVFIILPLVLSLLHPLRCLSRCIGRWPSLRICLDSYQGYYKDGTDGTRDYRWFSSLYLFSRIALFLVYAFIKNAFFYPFSSILLLVVVALIVICQPFKSRFKVYNTIHAFLFLNLATWFVAVICSAISVSKASYLDTFSLVLSGFVGILPLLYVTGLVLKWIYRQKIFRKLFGIVTLVFHLNKFKNSHQDDEFDSTESGSLPYRMERSEEQVHRQRLGNFNSSLYGTFQDNN